MNQDFKIIGAIMGVTALIFIGAIFYLNATNKGVGVADTSQLEQYLVRPDSQKIEASGSAKATIVEFGDYECPACAAAHPIIKRVLNDNQGQVTFVFRHFPLSGHKNAIPAAQAAEAAGEQGKFWEMHDLLYIRQSQWAGIDNPQEVFTGYARELGLDEGQFRTAIETNKFMQTIQQGQQDGSKVGVGGTPTIFVNGQRLRDYQYETLQRAIGN